MNRRLLRMTIPKAIVILSVTKSIKSSVNSNDIQIAQKKINIITYRWTWAKWRQKMYWRHSVNFKRNNYKVKALKVKYILKTYYGWIAHFLIFNLIVVLI